MKTKKKKFVVGLIIGVAVSASIPYIFWLSDDLKRNVKAGLYEKLADVVCQIDDAYYVKYGRRFTHRYVDYSNI